MSRAFKDVVVLRHGDAIGNHMVVKLTTDKDLEIFAIAVPQDSPIGTGPTWAYLFENEGLNLVDAGSRRSFQHLLSGIKHSGFSVKDIDRVIITHGHSDHDGAAKQLLEISDAKLWAHDLYSHLLPLNTWNIERGMKGQFRDEIHRVASANRTNQDRDTSEFLDKEYIDERTKLHVSYGVRANEQFGDMRFMHTPGHSPDEMCLTFHDLVFTGDHVLPEITPHPTTRVRYTEAIKQNLPLEYQNPDLLYGLKVYMKSLQQVADLESNFMVLPAHRLFNKNKFNFEGVNRAREIIQHHIGRLTHILKMADKDPSSLENLTKDLFPHRTLTGGALYMALSETVAHVELLEDIGDLELIEDNEVRSTGRNNYREFIQEITS